MVNHLQHNMTLNTFHAQMAVGSWSSTPLLPTVSFAADIIKSNKTKGKDKVVSVVEDISDDPDIIHIE